MTVIKRNEITYYSITKIPLIVAEDGVDRDDDTDDDDVDDDDAIHSFTSWVFDCITMILCSASSFSFRISFLNN